MTLVLMLQLVWVFFLTGINRDLSSPIPVTLLHHFLGFTGRKDMHASGWIPLNNLARPPFG